MKATVKRGTIVKNGKLAYDIFLWDNDHCLGTIEVTEISFAEL